MNYICVYKLWIPGDGVHIEFNTHSHFRARVGKLWKGGEERGGILKHLSTSCDVWGEVGLEGKDGGLGLNKIE